ncbi:unnamed protein product [Ostreobium quekettii]|uniref:Uncharacterized protein n=1 Tax=Ostreobium quekettii TaxID=121088 RepID=A0A8S1JHI8_9CHLO|nr:unnamed protein product [Ostreobium quekettii]
MATDSSRAVTTLDVVIGNGAPAPAPLVPRVSGTNLSAVAEVLPRGASCADRGCGSADPVEDHLQALVQKRVAVLVRSKRRAAERARVDEALRGIRQEAEERERWLTRLTGEVEDYELVGRAAEASALERLRRQLDVAGTMLEAQSSEAAARRGALEATVGELVAARAEMRWLAREEATPDSPCRACSIDELAALCDEALRLEKATKEDQERAAVVLAEMEEVDAEAEALRVALARETRRLYASRCAGAALRAEARGLEEETERAKERAGERTAEAAWIIDDIVDLSARLAGLDAATSCRDEQAQFCAGLLPQLRDTRRRVQGREMALALERSMSDRGPKRRTDDELCDVPSKEDPPSSLGSANSAASATADIKIGAASPTIELELAPPSPWYNEAAKEVTSTVSTVPGGMTNGSSHSRNHSQDSEEAAEAVELQGSIERNIDEETVLGGMTNGTSHSRDSDSQESEEAAEAVERQGSIETSIDIEAVPEGTTNGTGHPHCKSQDSKEAAEAVVRRGSIERTIDEETAVTHQSLGNGSGACAQGECASVGAQVPDAAGCSTANREKWVRKSLKKLMPGSLLHLGKPTGSRLG